VQIEFLLPIKAFSINQMSCRDARFKTPEYKDWATKVLYMLDEHKALVDMGKQHSELGGEFHVEISATFPPHVYRNQQGAISSKTIDCSNFEKPLIDIIFDKCMHVNDKYISRLVSSKCAAANYGIHVKITLNAA
jgi:Holliday junction resolvase RusA-like endonuclease